MKPGETITAKPGDALWKFGMELLLEDIAEKDKLIEGQSRIIGRLTKALFGLKLPDEKREINHAHSENEHATGGLSHE